MIMSMVLGKKVEMRVFELAKRKKKRILYLEY